MKTVRPGILHIAFLHLAPVPGDVEGNRNLLIHAVNKAASLGAQWIITPELCVCGYSFADHIGTDWIAPQPDSWMTTFCRQVAELQVTVFLAHPERDEHSGHLFNSVFVIVNGMIIGRHRKINALRVGSEAWSSPGVQATPIQVPPVGNVGIMICGDAFSPGIAIALKQQGAQMLVSSAAWAPGFHGPDGEWERCTQDTGLPLLVCNRSGADHTLDFTEAQTVVVKDGRRLISFSSPDSTIMIIEWDLAAANLATSTYQQCGV
jgi:N-carbamoylputrescine amidase